MGYRAGTHGSMPRSPWVDGEEPLGTREGILWSLEVPAFSVGIQDVVHATAQVADALAALHLAQEGKEEFQEFLLDDAVGCQPGLIIQEQCHGLGRLTGGAAGGERGDKGVEPVAVFYVESQAGDVVFRPRRVSLGAWGDLPSSAGEVEMLLCLGRVGQYLVVAARDVERDVHGLFLFHIQRILNGYSTDG